MPPEGIITQTLFTREQIQQRVEELAAEISRDYAGGEIFAICLLKGSLVFTTDLIRHLDIPVTVDMMRASSYGNSTVSSGSVKILLDLDTDITGRDVIIIEDIVDTGRTLHKTLHLLGVRNPKSLRICTMLNKPHHRVEELDIHYSGFTIDDHFVVGYGLDYQEYYRNLPYIGILDPNG